VWREEVGRRRDKLGKEKGKEEGRQKEREGRERWGVCVCLSSQTNQREHSSIV